jgi:hypothetical protein
MSNIMLYLIRNKGDINNYINEQKKNLNNNVY